MPQRKPSRKQPRPSRKTLWLGMAAVLLLACGLGYYWSNKPTAAPTTETPAPVTTPAPAPTQPFVARHIYSETANPTADIAAALAQAKHQHKRVLLDFGGDWCGDCQVLDIYFHQPPNAGLLEKNFVLVHIWIGHMDANLSVSAKYGVPINKGVPALAVLDAGGKPLFAQKTGEFENMRQMESRSVTEFLEKWKS